MLNIVSTQLNDVVAFEEKDHAEFCNGPLMQHLSNYVFDERGSLTLTFLFPPEFWKTDLKLDYEVMRKTFDYVEMERFLDDTAFQVYDHLKQRYTEAGFRVTVRINGNRYRHKGLE